MELCKVSAATESLAQVSHGIKENSCPFLLYSYFLPFGLVDSFLTDVEGLGAEMLLLQLALGHPLRQCSICPYPTHAPVARQHDPHP